MKHSVSWQINNLKILITCLRQNGSYVLAKLLIFILSNRKSCCGNKASDLFDTLWWPYQFVTVKECETVLLNQIKCSVPPPFKNENLVKFYGNYPTE